MKETRFFLLIPVFNTEKYIRQCIRSVESQDYDNFHIIIVDDGSPDQAGQICDEYASADQRITVIHQENQGLIAARDTAIKHLKQVAEGSDIAMFLDSDDMLAPGALRKLDHLFQREHPDMIMYRWVKMDENDTLKDSKNSRPFTGYHASKAELYKMVFSDWSYNSLCLKALRSDLLTNDSYSEYYHLSGGEDLLRSIPLYIHAEHILFIKDALYYYRVNGKSITQNADYDHYSVDTTIRRRVLEALEHENCWSEADFRDYFNQMSILLKREIISIVSGTSSKKICCSLLDKIREDSYYKKIYLSVYRRDLILDAVFWGKYSLIYLPLKMRKFLSKMLHAVIRR